MKKADTSNESTQRKAPDAWDRQATTCVLDAMHKAEVNFAVLELRLSKLGYDHSTPKNLEQRIKRGVFPAAFLLRVLKVVEMKSLPLEHIEVVTRADERKARVRLAREIEEARVREQEQLRKKNVARELRRQKAKD